MIEFIIMPGANTYTRRAILAGCLALAITAAVRTELERNRNLIDSGAIKVD